MKFRMAKGEFLKGLLAVRDALSGKDVIPILKNVLVITEKDENMIILRASNTELMVESILYGEMVQGDQVMAVPGMELVRLGQVLYGMGASGEPIEGQEEDEEPIEFNVLKNKLEVRASSSTVNLRLDANPDSFPDFPDYQISRKFDSDFMAALRKAAVTITNDSKAYRMRGVLLVGKNKRLEIFSSNSLAVTHIRGLRYYGPALKAVLPDNFVKKVLGFKEADFGFFDLKSFVGAELETEGNLTAIYHKKFGVDFADIPSITTKFGKKNILLSITVNRIRLLSAISAVNTLIFKEDTRLVRIDLEDEQLVITGASETLDYEDRVNVQERTGSEDLHLEVGPGTLLDFLNTARDEEVSFHFIGEDLPFRAEATEGYDYWIVPVKVRI